MRRALVVVAFLVAAFFIPVGDASASSPGWLVVCPYSHSGTTDPIVFPGMTDMSHLHDFLGNNSTGATSTYTSMTHSTSTCRAAADTAGYWIPALYRNGVRVTPSGAWAGVKVREQIYYRSNNLTSGTKVRAFPSDLRMVAGNSHATSVAGNPMLGREIYWGCSDNSESGKLTAPPASCATGIISLHVGFPNCWNGLRSGSNDTADLTYPKGGVCPSAFPIPLPRIIERFEYPVGTSTGQITLASGPSYTVHADFWNTWQQAQLETLVTNCLNAGKDCGTLSS